jgi:hypothetical protein
MPETRVLTCGLVGRGSSWEAICFDFDIAVQGDSVVDVQGKLSAAIESYLEYVATLPEEERNRLLSRRAPWHVRAKFTMGMVATMLFHRSGGSGKQSFGLPCAV